MHKDGTLNWHFFTYKSVDTSDEAAKKFLSIIPDRSQFVVTEYVDSYEDLVVFTTLALRIKTACVSVHKYITNFNTFEELEKKYLNMTSKLYPFSSQNPLDFGLKKDTILMSCCSLIHV